MGDFPHPSNLAKKIYTNPSSSSWRGRQKERTAVDWWRQLEQRCELRSRLCELEQRLVECECEHLGSNYFNVYEIINDTQRTSVLRHRKMSAFPEPRQLVHKYSQCSAETNRTCAGNVKRPARGVSKSDKNGRKLKALHRVKQAQREQRTRTT